MHPSTLLLLAAAATTAFSDVPSHPASNIGISVPHHKSLPRPVRSQYNRNDAGATTREQKGKQRLVVHKREEKEQTGSALIEMKNRQQTSHPPDINSATQNQPAVLFLREDPRSITSPHTLLRHRRSSPAAATATGKPKRNGQPDQNHPRQNSDTFLGLVIAVCGGALAYASW